MTLCARNDGSGQAPRIAVAALAKRFVSFGEVHGELFRDIRPVNTIMQVSSFIDREWLLEREVDALVADQ